MLQAGTLAFLAGILLLQVQAALPPVWCLYLFPFALIGLFFTRRRALQLAFCLAIGFLWAQYHAQSLLQQRLPPDLGHKQIAVHGYVASLPERNGDRTRFEFDIAQVESHSVAHFPRKVLLSWYDDSPSDIQPGDEWQLNLRLRTPHRFMSPGTFDYSAWLLQKGIVATGYVVKSGGQRRLSQRSWRYPVESLRFHCQRYLLTTLAGVPAEGLIRALLIGDRSGVSRAQWTTLQQTGTVHLMAISGLHIGLIAGFVFFITLRLWRVLPRLCLLLPAPKAAALFAWLAALLYAALAGFAIPTQRALIMLAVILLSVFLQRRHKPSQVIALALVLVLGWDPFAVLSASFWLSFGAVALIYYVLLIRPLRVARLSHWWRMQLAVSLGLLPLVILFFQQAPLLSPLTNLVAIPWVSLLVLPLAMLSMLISVVSQDLGVWGLHLATQLMQLLERGLVWAAGWKASLLSIPTPGLTALLLAFCGVAMVMLPRQFRVRILGIVLCLPVLLPTANRPDVGNVRLSLLDVGQGLAAVVQTAQHTLVFDTGPRFGPTFDAGEAIILPYLRQAQVRGIDTLILSHSDMDHVGGMTSLLRTMPVRHIISSVPEYLRDKRDTPCLAGQHWRWDEVAFDILYPSAVEFANISTDNNRSCVLQITTAHQRLLLTGDIEAPAETLLVDRYGQKLQSGLLVLAHHGSNTSSTPEFLDTVRPEIVLIPAGWHNRFHLPAERVIARLASRELHVLTTATAGTIEIDTGSRLQIRPYRASHRHYWQVW
ncbi:MAG: DNA internalization-related competence protein ComEC/Rec2 [Gammaproteobacteria bacterium]|nr:DNA internalization-related competence protein ComEC/Rec2 [Gammaproteobacteria bacterium]